MSKMSMLTVRSPGGAMAHLCDRLPGAGLLSPSSNSAHWAGQGTGLDVGVGIGTKLS